MAAVKMLAGCCSAPMFPIIHIVKSILNLYSGVRMKTVGKMAGSGQ